MQIMDKFFSIGISALALVVSIFTAWLTLFRRGTISMTRPSLIVFCPEQPYGEREKIFLRTLLYSTSKRGNVIETMYVKLTNGCVSQRFDFWGYGSNSLSFGSGLFVGQEGVAHNHHFVLRKDLPRFNFPPGEYSVETFVTLVHRAGPIMLSRQHLSINQEQSDSINRKSSHLFFHWDPELASYIPYVDRDKIAELNLRLGVKNSITHNRTDRI
jgi:hypothetical protein